MLFLRTPYKYILKMCIYHQLFLKYPRLIIYIM